MTSTKLLLWDTGGLHCLADYMCVRTLVPVTMALFEVVPCVPDGDGSSIDLA